MIRVDPTAVRIPAILSELKGPAARERARAIAFYCHRDNSDQVFDFVVYRSREIREALVSLFHGKCSYCESRCAGTQPIEVDHWRPKGMIVAADGKSIRPGYYWLAADWSNLLPACIDCNRQRNQVAASGEGRLMGKGSRFPLANESRRARAPREEALEEPLLLHPYFDDPSSHLTFTPEAVARPTVDAAGRSSRKGTTSIEVYGLNRSALVQDRRALLLLVWQRLYTIQCLAQLLDAKLDDAVAGLICDILRHELLAIYRWQQPESPFALLVRQELARFSHKLFGIEMLP